MNPSARRTLFILLALVGCGTKSTPTDGGAPADLSRPELGMPIPAAMNTWTWTDFSDSSCDDGTPTGIGINPGDPKKLLVFLNGGGACWSYATCIALGTATHGPFGKTQFDAQVAANSLAGTLFDRQSATNPFRDYSFVFVPYCTGDLHGGDNVITYSQNGDSHVYHHKGHANMVAFIPRIAATWPATDKAILSGASAGGYGTGLNYDLFRHYFPTGESYMLDDSGPPLKATDFPAGFRDAFYASWNLGADLDGICPTCRMDIAAIIPTLGNLYPKDRFALLSSLQDMTISGYLLLSPSGFQTALLDLAATVIDPQPNFKYFIVPGNTHTMLGQIESTTSNGVGKSGGVALSAWLKQFATDDPSWMSLKP